jgi:hypothetical protein
VERRLRPARADLESLVGVVTVVSEDFVAPVDLGSAIGTSTQLMSESLSLSHMSISESGVALAGWGMPSAEVVGSDGLSEDGLIAGMNVSSVDGIIGPSLVLMSVRPRLKFKT